ncbi:Autophagy-related protein [Lachnellula occidentalis]|uniref:Autophagy-related protein n=1 Tax=Lachnellula occidentalis TaxID=215460 RepID=A0A8H8RWP8_9HELO|nr:Autophagy-related protein [Lachnellula occidentalis]
MTIETAPDKFDERYRTTKKEIYAYYSYYVGNNGLTLFNFAPSAFQNLLSQAAGNEGTLPFAGKSRSVNSIVLLSNGISFAIQVVLFLILGSFADFGNWRPNILIVQSFFAYAIGFGWIGVHTEDKWRIATGLYIVGLVVYQTTFTFWNAAFPGLARNTPEMKDKADAYIAGTITRDEYNYADSLMRSRLANVALCIQSLAEVFMLAIIIGIMFGLKVKDSDANNNWGLSVIITFGSAIWLIVSLPWFFLETSSGTGPWEKIHRYRRVVADLARPQGHLEAQAESRYFLLGDSLNTTFTVVTTLQNTIVAYNALQLAYLLILGITAQGLGIFTFWWCQKRFKLGTKTMFNIVAVSIVSLDAWGMIGVWTDRFGFHNLWEFWIYFGFLVCPWYSYSQIMISEVTPRGHEFLFFSLFSIVGKTSSFIGPVVSSAIIDRTNNSWTPFYFLFSLSLASCLVLVLFVDLKKSQVEQEKFLEGKARRLVEKLEASNSGLANEKGVTGRDVSRTTK